MFMLIDAKLQMHLHLEIVTLAQGCGPNPARGVVFKYNLIIYHVKKSLKIFFF